MQSIFRRCVCTDNGYGCIAALRQKGIRSFSVFCIRNLAVAVRSRSVYLSAAALRFFGGMYYAFAQPPLQKKSSVETKLFR